MKKCTKCKQEKPKDQFVPKPHKSDGRSSQCRECEKEVIRKRNEEIKKRKEFEII